MTHGRTKIIACRTVIEEMKSLPIRNHHSSVSDVFHIYIDRTDEESALSIAAKSSEMG